MFCVERDFYRLQEVEVRSDILFCVFEEVSGESYFSRFKVRLFCGKDVAVRRRVLS